MLPFRAFTLSSNSLQRVLQGPVDICAGFDPHAANQVAHPTMKAFTAIWDTGASASVITQDVVDSCGLKATGVLQVHGVHGTELAETFLVNIALPNAVAFPLVTVTKGKLVGGAHALIGMDIIGAGDFSVTNFGNRTVMSFRCPSVEERDFVKDAAKLQQKIPKGSSGGMSGGNKKGRRHRR